MRPNENPTKAENKSDKCDLLLRVSDVTKTAVTLAPATPPKPSASAKPNNPLTNMKLRRINQMIMMSPFFWVGNMQ